VTDAAQLQANQFERPVRNAKPNARFARAGAHAAASRGRNFGNGRLTFFGAIPLFEPWFFRLRSIPPIPFAGFLSFRVEAGVARRFFVAGGGLARPSGRNVKMAIGSRAGFVAQLPCLNDGFGYSLLPGIDGVESAGDAKRLPENSGRTWNPVVEEQQNQCRKRNDEYGPAKFRKPDVAQD